MWKALVIASALTAGIVALATPEQSARAETMTCTLVANSHAWVEVWDEEANNGRGTQRVSEREVHKDQVIASIPTSRGRIIYRYRYGAGDPWNPYEVHAWCHNGDRVRIP